MIYFYNKVLLFLIPLSLLPILLHLLSFRNTKRIKFTYVNILYQILKQYHPKRKLIDIIVLTLRCLIIFLIIIFLAHPIMYINPAKLNSNKIIVLLDNSLSMQQKVLNTTKLEICKNVLSNLLKEMQKYNVSIELFVFNENIIPIQDNSSFITAELLDKIKNVKPTYFATDIYSCLSWILDKYNDFSLKILVFTDLAEHIINRDFEYEKKLNNNVEISFCYPKEVEKNRYIDSVEFLENKDFIDIKYQPVVNSKSDLSEAELVINDKLVDKKTISDYSKKSKFTYIYNNPKDKELYGYIKLSSDSLTEDNLFYFVYQKSDDYKKIICLINEPLYIKGFISKKYYFEKLKSINTQVDIKCMEDINESNFDLQDYEVIICVGLNNFDKINMEDKNKIFIIFPDEKINLENYDLAFSGLEFIEMQEANLKEYKPNLGDVSEFNKFLEKFDYQNIYFKKRFLVTIRNSDLYKTLIKYNDGYPALINKDNIYIFTFYIDKDCTNFMYKPLFVGLIEYILKYNQMSINQELKPYYIISEKINLNNIKEITPVYSLNVLDKYYGTNYDSVVFFTPGIYEIKFLNGEKNKIAINISKEESKIDIIDKAKIKKSFSKLKIFFRYFDIRKDKVETILNWLFGKDISQTIIFIIATLFILETILSRLSKRII